MERKIRLVGLKYLSIARRDQTGPVHRILLGEDVVIIEGPKLGDVRPGQRRSYCLPLKL